MDRDEFEEQREELDRVRSRIGFAVLCFCREHRSFHADDLRRWVIETAGIAAPASADRVLRDLRQRGKLNYIVTSRRASQYVVLFVAGDGGGPEGVLP